MSLTMSLDEHDLTKELNTAKEIILDMLEIEGFLDKEQVKYIQENYAIAIKKGNTWEKMLSKIRSREDKKFYYQMVKLVDTKATKPPIKKELNNNEPEEDRDRSKDLARFNLEE